MITHWEKLKEEPGKIGWRRFLRKVFRLPHGKEVEFVTKDEPDPVCVVAFTKDRQIVMTRQFRPGPEKILLELPGGAVEKGESLEQAAKREFLEETGYDGRIEYIGGSLNCAYSNRCTQTFIILDAEKVAEPCLDENEFVEVVLMSLEDFRKHLRSGEMTDVKSGYLALDYLNLL